MNERPSDTVMDAWAALLRAGQVALAAVEADLKAAGFPPLVWYDALLEIWRAGDAGLRPAELERRMLLAQYSVSRLTDRLTQAALIERREVPGDRRAALFVLTAGGADLLQRMWPAYAAAVGRHVGARLSESEAATLRDGLRKLAGRR